MGIITIEVRPQCAHNSDLCIASTGVLCLPSIACGKQPPTLLPCRLHTDRLPLLPLFLCRMCWRRCASQQGEGAEEAAGVGANRLCWAQAYEEYSLGGNNHRPQCRLLTFARCPSVFFCCSCSSRRLSMRPTNVSCRWEPCWWQPVCTVPSHLPTRLLRWPAACSRQLHVAAPPQLSMLHCSAPFLLQMRTTCRPCTWRRRCVCCAHMATCSCM